MYDTYEIHCDKNTHSPRRIKVEEGLYLFSVSSTLLVKDKPLRGAYASLTSVDDTLLLKQAISPSLCIADATNKDGTRLAAIYKTGGAGKT